MAHISILEPPASALEQRAGQIPDPVERLRFLRREMRPQIQQRKSKKSWTRAGWLAAGLAALVVLVPVSTGTAETLAKERLLVAPDAPKTALTAEATPRVWLVDRSESSELYSNGLRIDLRFAVSNRPRRPFPIFSTGGIRQGEGNAPVGIVYHTTESNIAPFEEKENRQLQVSGRSAIDVVRQERAYHYQIDRFGRVFRVVQESDAANHAGASVWADARGVYVNLNDSFLGVSVEGQTSAADAITPAQIASAKVLTEMLRSRYAIPAENCVTHAQVSVNPQNMHIGDHTDWAGKFPFAEVGLPDNYAIPLASLYVFGFDYDSVFLRVTGVRWRGLDLAELWVARQAAAEGVETGKYRSVLRRRYKDIEIALKEEQGEEAGK